MTDVQGSLDAAMAIDGAIGGALVDFDSGVCLGAKGGDTVDMELAGAAVTEVIRTKKQIVDDLGLDESMEEIISTLNGQYHLIQGIDQYPGLFLYLILDREQASLPLARSQLRATGRDLELDDRFAEEEQETVRSSA
jgi:predicted regulator of Ras-like GTPase activity (Roadblock/LC7/MglB family)